MCSFDIYGYNTYIFDFDGVIFDSNNIKKNAIKKVASDLLSQENAEEFISYFIKNNGVPRQQKISKFFPKQIYQEALSSYEKLLDEDLKKAKPVPGVIKFIQKIASLNKEMIILSGGELNEIFFLLREFGLESYFSSVLAGPNSKSENLKRVTIINPAIYFGDSAEDYKTSQKNNFDFIFISGYTNISNYKKEIATWNIIHTIMDFNKLEF